METMLRPTASGQTRQLSLRVADRTLQWLSRDLRTAMVHRLARHAPSRTDAEDAYQVALTALVTRSSQDARPVEVEPTGGLRRQRLLAFLYVVGKRYLFRLQREESMASRWIEKRSVEQVSLPGPGGEANLDGYLVREVLLELSHEDAPTDILDGFRLIQSEVLRCKGIIDSLLDFSRPKAGDKTLVNVNDAIERTLYVLKYHTRFKKLSVQVELDRSLSAVVLANAEQLMQVYMSLLINAMDAMQDNGTVTLRTRWGEDASSVVSEIIDQGSGIRRADLPKIFEPFFTTKPPGRGTGLGLSICYAIVAEHDGRIEVDSAPGEGSVFRIILPRGDVTEDNS